ncbi:MAG: hypothetical protein H6741_30380 [Alphaproteobacteria bacterium]|nr:hypothetical protein [Alphaproteobacteria bacterium]
MQLSLLLTALLGCKGEAPAVDSEPVCDAVALASLPEDGEDVIGTNARVYLDVQGRVSPDGASLMTDPEVAYAASVEDGRVVFTPEAPLTPEQTYTWSAELCGEAVASGSFTPRAQGEDADPEALQGRTYAVDLSEATWIEPANGGDLFAQLFGGLLLLGVQEAEGERLSIMGAVGEDIDGYRQQDPCYETIVFADADFSRNPYLELGPAEFPLVVQGQDVILHDLHLFGAFTEQGVALGDATIAAQGDLRDVFGAEYGAWCGQLQQFGLTCASCVSDNAMACVDLLVSGIHGGVVPGLRLQTVTEPAAECGRDTGRG